MCCKADKFPVFLCTVLTELGETNVLGVFTEALTADLHAVLTDDTALIGAYAAAGKKRKTDHQRNVAR